MKAGKGLMNGKNALISVLLTPIMLFTLMTAPSHSTEITGVFYDRPTFKHLGVGESSACATSESGEVWCWGSNSKYQTTSRLSLFESTPIKVGGISNAIQVSVGKEHACALLQTGRVLCWGSNEYGQIGTGFDSNSLPVSIFPEYVNGVTDVASIYSGDNHNCAITAQKELFCWGGNSRGQVGQLFSDESRQTTGRSTIPQAERVNINSVVDVGLGSTHTCAVTEKGYTYCWGDNIYGQLGQGWRVDKSYMPMIVGSLTDMREIDSSGNSICATDKSSSMRCWGAGENGQLGNLDTADLALPTNSSVALAKYSISKFSVGIRSTCARLDNSAVFCWGSNQFAQVGLSNVQTIQTSPFASVQYSSLDALQIESGGDFSCVLTGNVWCWGKNNLGQLGQMRSSTFSVVGQINNPRWNLASNAITHKLNSNVATLSWPQIGVTQRYARVESSRRELLCQTNTALTCDFPLDKTGQIVVVLFLQVTDLAGVNQSARAEYSIDVKEIISQAEAKLAEELLADQKALADKLFNEENLRKAAKLALELEIAEAKRIAAEAKLEKVNLLLEEVTELYLAAKKRSSATTDMLSLALEKYISNNLALSKIVKQLGGKS